MAVQQLSKGSAAGVCLGQSATDLIAFHGATPTDKCAFVSDAVVAHALNSTFSDTEAEAALNALGVKINAILDILEEKGLMAAS
jgi:hypothetical protein